MEKIRIKDLCVQVKQTPRRKTVELTVERDGRIIVYAPLSASQDELTSLIKEKFVWIYQRLGRKREELHQLPLKEFVSGEGFYYRGRRYRLKLLDKAIPAMKNEKLKFLNSRFWMLRKFASKGYDIFAAWYAQRAAEWVPQRVQFLQGRVGVESGLIEIRDIGFRWGSCTENGKLFFHWRLILIDLVNFKIEITDPWLAALAGGIVVGAGAGIIFRGRIPPVGSIQSVYPCSG